MTAVDDGGLEVADTCCRRGPRRRLEPVGLAAEHELEQRRIGRGEGHVADALADQAGRSASSSARCSLGRHGGRQLGEATAASSASRSSIDAK